MWKTTSHKGLQTTKTKINIDTIWKDTVRIVQLDTILDTITQVVRDTIYSKAEANINGFEVDTSSLLWEYEQIGILPVHTSLALDNGDTARLFLLVNIMQPENSTGHIQVESKREFIDTIVIPIQTTNTLIEVQTEKEIIKTIETQLSNPKLWTIVGGGGVEFPVDGTLDFDFLLGLGLITPNNDYIGLDYAVIDKSVVLSFKKKLFSIRQRKPKLL